MGHCSSKQQSSSQQIIMIDLSLPSSNNRRRGTNNKSKRVADETFRSSMISIGRTIYHKPKQHRLVTNEDNSQSSDTTSHTTVQSSLANSSTDGQRTLAVLDRQLVMPHQNKSTSHYHHKQEKEPPQIKLATRTFAQTYQILPHLKLGHGIAGQVHQCIHRPSSRICAVKIMTKSQIRRKDRIKREIAFLRQVQHPNIIRLYDAYEDENEVHIVTEMCRGGELFDKIVEKATLGIKNRSDTNGGAIQPACFRERDAAHIIHSLLSAVSYLHSNDIIHRDLKPENILFNDESSSIKLIDFGLSIRHNSKHSPPLSNIVGTSYYMAPELLEGSYDRSCDLWSIGVIAYVLLSGRPPFNGNSDDVIFKKIKRGGFKMENSTFWDHGVSEHGKDFIRCLLDMDPRRRLTANKALEHAWLEP
eukprot:CAMPEP_0172313412 /NCGR_PEP_ID=MMETSP1058-20130122/20156_1 /TAXON_ID=83371 /ORGANISM="Detonula confervacea, Strain CCMP 353" /LENGTH=416 /DNA_ID=CAMNT_0013027057 /DNA_START=19 /DNA_END=1266 /DNA_ORIENTATION=-